MTPQHPDDCDALLEEGRRLASQRDDLIAQGVDPDALEVPLALHRCPDCSAPRVDGVFGEGPQHPAAPEGEADASGLTEAEIKALLSVERDEDAIAAVERIVAERLRVVEGERDRWQDKAQEAGEAYGLANSRHHEELDRANRLERLADRLAERAVELEDDARAATARAESAEAAHESLRAGVEALAKVIAAEVWRIHGPDSTDEDGAAMDGEDIARAILASRWLAAHVSAAETKARADERERIAEAMREQYDGYLSSPRLDPAWIAGWHAATNHHAASIARGDAR